MDQTLQQVQDTIRLPLYAESTERAFAQGTRTNLLADSMLINCWASKQAFQNQYGSTNNVYTINKRPGLAYGSPNFDSIVGAGNENTVRVVAALGMSQIPLRSIVAITSGGLNYVCQVNASGTIVNLGTWVYPTGYVFGIHAHLTEITTGGVPGIMFTVSDSRYTHSKMYYATATGGSGAPFTEFNAASLTLIVDADAPSNVAGECAVGPAIQLNEHIFQMGRTGKIYNSDDVTAVAANAASWGGAAIISSYMESDLGLGLAKYKNHLAAFSDSSIEFFEDAGLAPPGSPLQRVEQGFVKFGALNSMCYINIDDTLYWLASGTQATTGLWKLENYTPIKLSDHTKSSYFTPGNWVTRLNTITMMGTRHIIINNVSYTSGYSFKPRMLDGVTFTPAAGADYETYPIASNDIESNTLMYSIDDQTWWWWADGGVARCGLFVANVMTDFGVNEQHVYKVSTYSSTNYVPATAGTESRGPFIYYDTIQGQASFMDFKLDSSADNAVCITIQLPYVENQTEKIKFISKIKLICDFFMKYPAGPTAPNLAADTSTGNQIYFCINKNDGLTGTYIRNLQIPNTSNRYYLNNWGRYRRLSLALVMKNQMPFRGFALEMDLTQGTA